MNNDEVEDPEFKQMIKNLKKYYLNMNDKAQLKLIRKLLKMPTELLKMEG